MSALCAAARNGHETCMQPLLACPGVSVDRPGYYRDAGIADLPLNIAVRAGKPTVVQLLLSREDANVEQVDCYPDEKQFEDMGEVEFEDEYEERKQDYCGQTAFESAMTGGTAGHAQVVRLLKSAKSDETRR